MPEICFSGGSKIVPRGCREDKIWPQGGGGANFFAPKTFEAAPDFFSNKLFSVMEGESIFSL